MQQFYLYTLKDSNSCELKHCSQQHYLYQPKSGNKLDIYQKMIGFLKYDIYIKWNTIQTRPIYLSTLKIVSDSSCSCSVPWDNSQITLNLSPKLAMKYLTFIIFTSLQYNNSLWKQKTAFYLQHPVFSNSILIYRIL